MAVKPLQALLWVMIGELIQFLSIDVSGKIAFFFEGGHKNVKILSSGEDKNA